MNSSPSFPVDPSNVELMQRISVLPALFLMLGAGLVVSVLISRRKESLSLGKMILAGFSLLWLVPIFVLLPFVLYRFVGRMDAPSTDAPAQAVEVAEGPGVSLGETTAIGENTIDENIVPAPPLTSSSAPAPTPALPDWVKEHRIVGDEKELLVLTSQQYPLVETADAEIRALARKQIQQDLKQVYHYDGAAPVPDLEIDKVLGRRHVEEITRHAGANSFRVYRVYRQLEISPSMRKSLESLWREQNGKAHLLALTALAGFLTLIVATINGYLRLDTRTGSAFRGRLRFAAVCVIVGGGLIAMQMFAA